MAGGNLLQAIGLPPEWFQSVMGGVANGMEAPEQPAPAGIQSVDPDTGVPSNGPILNGAPGPQAPQGGGLTDNWFQGVMGNQAGQPQPQIPAEPQGPSSGLSPEWFQGVMDMPGEATGKPTNLLEGLGYENAPPSAVQAPGPAAPPQKSRRSLLSTIGQISDVLAKVGGAEALYQPTLDAREDRTLALGDHARAVDLDKLKLVLAGQQVEGGRNDLANAETAKVGLGVRGLQAIAARGGDPTRAWPVLAQQLGIDPERAAVIGDAIAKDPNAVFGLNASLNGPQSGAGEYGLQPFFAKDATGNVTAYQLGKDGSIHPVALPNGQQPVGTGVGTIDNGDANVIYDKRTGDPIRVMPKAGGPSTGQRPIVDAQGRVVGYEDLPGARLPQGRGGGAKAQQDFEQRTAGTQAALANIGELRSIYGKLDEAGAMVNPNNSTVGNIGARLRASGPGQMVEGAVGTEAQTMRDRVNSIRPGMMQAIAKATGMTGKQLDSNADVQLWMRTVTDPTSSYQANMAALDGLERFIRLNTPKAPAAESGGGQPRRALPPRVGQPQRAAPQRAAPKPQARRASAPPGYGSRTTRPGKPTVSNW